MKTSQCLMLVMITIATTFTTISIRTEAATTAPAPSPSDDCSTTIYTLTPCLPFVEEGNNTAAKPSNDCCSALADIVKSDVRCLCVALKMASGIGIPVNMTKALSLPQACDIKTPPVSDCDHGAPTPAPAPGT
ncbi:hypothetical protein QJS10_CPA06g00621 [Acorus calamus]|uniref:Bifunctional inhibitor/plant lipid transfer protein/seed storage helical domain-containing protein n=1 Tax=Acorus calamus TaxID=4465 RepID=A0AAV9EP04_ACOCL|nr:hypothetical protein QJS10_CPA06g00621 [Acorus calamus]